MTSCPLTPNKKSPQKSRAFFSFFCFLFFYLLRLSNHVPFDKVKKILDFEYLRNEDFFETDIQFEEFV